MHAPTTTYLRRPLIASLAKRHPRLTGLIRDPRDCSEHLKSGSDPRGRSELARSCSYMVRRTCSESLMTQARLRTRTAGVSKYRCCQLATILTRLGIASENERDSTLSEMRELTMEVQGAKRELAPGDYIGSEMYCGGASCTMNKLQAIKLCFDNTLAWILRCDDHRLATQTTLRLQDRRGFSNV